MDMTGERRIPAPKQTVWDALNDPDILKASIPGCQTLDKLSDTEMTATAAMMTTATADLASTPFLAVGATLIASSAWCAHQAFVLGPHLGMQCHVEMTPELIRAWCADWEQEVASLAKRTASVQTPEEILREVEARVVSLNAVATRLYDRWIEGLVR